MAVKPVDPWPQPKVRTGRWSSGCGPGWSQLPRTALVVRELALSYRAQHPTLAALWVAVSEDAVTGCPVWAGFVGRAREDFAEPGEIRRD